MRNIVLQIAYDGSHYLGWQATLSGQSIEETLQNTLEKILQHPIHLQAASRTDAGVHAQGQIVNFTTSSPRFGLSQVFKSLNQLLPKDIAVLNLWEAPLHFHPTLDCIGKEYHYTLCFGPVQLPHHRHFSWHYPYPLNIEHMQASLPYFLGTHDFSSLCNTKKNEPYKNKDRQIIRLEIILLEADRLRIEVMGNHFLYKMVRNLVGTLVYVGRGKLAVDQIPLILNARSRVAAGITAPAHGLNLFKIFYPLSSYDSTK